MGTSEALKSLRACLPVLEWAARVCADSPNGVDDPDEIREVREVLGLEELIRCVESVERELHDAANLTNQLVGVIGRMADMETLLNVELEKQAVEIDRLKARLGARPASSYPPVSSPTTLKTASTWIWDGSGPRLLGCGE